MSAGSHVADTIRTLLIAATVVFLGYLGYTLLQARINNPPPQVVTMDDENLEDLRAQIKSMERKLSSPRDSNEMATLRTGLDKLSHRLESKLAEGGALPVGTVIEYGTVNVKFTVAANDACADVSFTNRYRSPPVVLALDNKATGHFPIVKARGITSTGCNLNATNRACPKQDYVTRIGYIVIGERVD